MSLNPLFPTDGAPARLHYIPLSSSYKEIYNIHAFFSGTPPSALVVGNSTTLYLPPSKRRSVEGDRRLRRIARAGKQWKKTIGRTIDMEGWCSTSIIHSIWLILLWRRQLMCIECAWSTLDSGQMTVILWPIRCEIIVCSGLGFIHWFLVLHCIEVIVPAIQLVSMVNIYYDRQQTPYTILQSFVTAHNVQPPPGRDDQFQLAPALVLLCLPAFPELLAVLSVAT